MLDAIVWGLVQGLTEFLPISSSGHLALVPAFLGLDPPDLATSALLHLGTLLAVVAYYREDLTALVRRPTEPRNRHLLLLLALGTLPALVGLPLEGRLDELQRRPRAVGVALLVTAVVLFVSAWLRRHPWTGKPGRSLEEAGPLDAIVVGIGQALALVPGISRSGTSITAGLGRGLADEEAARLSFLLAIPAIAGGGFLKLLDLADGGGIRPELWVGVAVAGVSGYLAIAVLIRTMVRVGLAPFGWYCAAVGLAAIVLL